MPERPPGNPIVSFASPSSLYCPPRQPKSPGVLTPTPRSQGDEGAAGVFQGSSATSLPLWSYSTHHCHGPTPASLLQRRRRSCCPTLLSPSVDFLASSKVTLTDCFSASSFLPFIKLTLVISDSMFCNRIAVLISF